VGFKGNKGIILKYKRWWRKLNDIDFNDGWRKLNDIGFNDGLIM
jgi:hypothetical protein